MATGNLCSSPRALGSGEELGELREEEAVGHLHTYSEAGAHTDSMSWTSVSLLVVNLNIQELWSSNSFIAIFTHPFFT